MELFSQWNMLFGITRAHVTGHGEEIRLCSVLSHSTQYEIVVCQVVSCPILQIAADYTLYANAENRTTLYLSGHRNSAINQVPPMSHCLINNAFIRVERTLPYMFIQGYCDQGKGMTPLS